MLVIETKYVGVTTSSSTVSVLKWEVVCLTVSLVQALAEGMMWFGHYEKNL